VALVAALASEVDLYILDEPTSGLDPLMEAKFQESVRELKQAGKTILLSSHILAEVEALCDRITIIREGTAVESGTLAELRHLTRTSMKITTEKPITGLEQIKGVHDVKAEGGHTELEVETHAIDDVLRHVMPYGVRGLVSAPPSLEELFMRHYAEGPTEQGVAGEKR
jgi:ABC-2 type transport system ATP-binding protein